MQKAIIKIDGTDHECKWSFDNELGPNCKVEVWYQGKNEVEVIPIEACSSDSYIEFWVEELLKRIVAKA